MIDDEEQAKRQDNDLQTMIGMLRYFRDILLQNDDYYKESEMAYQLVSLLIAIDNVLKDGNVEREREYLAEKAGTVYRCFRDMISEKLRT